ncbi:MAG TPA: MFS transporter [Candidatus Avipropionibacterium avicola]|uniref:MFS transporter n=1 Tax=Candidatus Avipropionibacterium avicola TaxID=2840701 RepID=A0A9D1GXB3_9ACTN|nr:MFS transporter [Candidatus Avipropionibacterium avicola]
MLRRVTRPDPEPTQPEPSVQPEPAPVPAAPVDTSATPTVEEVAYTGLGPQGRRVFIGLMLGMFVASISQTLVSPAMPRIVAELGGMDHYAWIATAAMLVSAVVTPVVGKLSDLYGRRGFYLAGLCVFMVGSVISGSAQEFWVLVAGRAVQGMGMGTLMPLSQTIIGDIIPPRQRGKYQGLMGAVFGMSSVAGPLAGGLITDHLGWRMLFFIPLPIGIAAFFAITRFLHLPHQRRRAKIDVAGIITLTISMVTLLLATSWGGATYPWSSPVIISMYVGGALVLAAFIVIETRASEPLLPLRLFAKRTFTFANVSAFAVSIAMFGAIFYIPVYAQGVHGVGAAESGLITMPLMLAMVLTGMAAGLLVTRTGRYKSIILGGVCLVALGYVLLSLLEYGDPEWRITLAMLVTGIGLGACNQNFLLVVQNTAGPTNMGIATASTQFFRNMGSTIGVTIFGSIMTLQLPKAVANHLPEGADSSTAGGAGLGSVLDPSQLEALPAPIAEAIRMGLADALHVVFLSAFPVLALALVSAALIKSMPLRTTLQRVQTPAKVEPVPARAQADSVPPRPQADSVPSATATDAESGSR